MMMTEQQKQGLVCCDKLPPLCAKYPWLVADCLEDDGIRDHYFYNIDNPLSHYRCRIPELLGKHIRGFFHGWVILSDNIMWSLWNPLNSKVIRLPPLNMVKDGDFDNDIKQCCLSSPPNNPGSVLLLTRTNKPAFVFCRLDCKRKKLRWTEMSYAKQLKKITIDGGLLHSITCCNGKVYALSTGGIVANFVIQIDIVVKDKEVVIKLLVFGECPYRDYPYMIASPHDDCFFFLKGSSTKLFYIFLEGTKKTIATVTLFELDMTSIKWEELERLKDWDLTNKRVEELNEEDIADLFITARMWKEMSDLKDAIFFVDLDRDCSIFYNPAIRSELGGYIHIRDEMDNVMFSYHVNHKTIVPSTIPFPILPTSQVSMWEYRLEDDDGEAKCIADSTQPDEIVVRSVTHDEVEFKESSLLTYPIDILEMIIKFCVGVEYLNFRATCQQCRLVAPVIHWREETSIRRRRLLNYSLASPLLMVLDKNRDIITFTDPKLGENYFMKNSQLSIIEGTRIYCSRYGWLLFKIIDEFPRCVLFNPFTKDIHKLPKSYHFFESLCFSAPPTSPDCMLVGFTQNREKWYAHIFYVARQPTAGRMFTLGGDLIDMDDDLDEAVWDIIDLGDDITSIRFPTFYGGDLYALCNEGNIIIMKHLLEEDYSSKVIEAKVPESGCKSEGQYYMMTCDQHLLLVIVGKFGKSVEVFKHKGSAEEWEKVDDLGKYMIYISDTTCLCIDAQTPDMGNKIYFPCLHPTNGKVVFYSLETCMFHAFNGGNIEQYPGGLFRTVHHHNPLAWIEPSWC